MTYMKMTKSELIEELAKQRAEIKQLHQAKFELIAEIKQLRFYQEQVDAVQADVNWPRNSNSMGGGAPFSIKEGFEELHKTLANAMDEIVRTKKALRDDTNELNYIIDDERRKLRQAKCDSFDCVMAIRAGIESFNGN